MSSHQLNIRYKAAIIISSLFILYLSITTVVLYKFILEDLTGLEEQKAEKDIERCRMAIDREVECVDMLAREWGGREDIYRFTANRELPLIKADLSAESFIFNRINLIYILDPFGKVLYGKIFSSDWKEEIVLHSFPRIFSSQILFTDNSYSKISKSGVLVTEKGYMMIASCPIMSSKKNEAAIGYIVIGRFLTDKIVKNLNEQTKVLFSLLPIDDDTPDYMQLVRDDIYAPHPPPSRIRIGLNNDDDELLELILLYKDISGKPAFKIRTTFKRDIHSKGKSIFNLTIISITAAGLLALFLILLFLKHYIFSPLSNLAADLASVSAKEDLSISFDSDRSDEIGMLMRSFEKIRHWILEDNLRLELLVTNLQNAVAAAEESDRTKSIFLANMSHEIRTPMNSVLGMTELLSETSLSGEQRQFVNAVLESGRSLMRTINDIIDFSKLESGRVRLEDKPYNIRDIVEDTAYLFAPAAHEKGLEIAVMIDPEADVILKGDQERIKQILSNLIGNAVKFTPDGEIIIKVSIQDSTDLLHYQKKFQLVNRVEDEVVRKSNISFSNMEEDLLLKISIRDTGIGISRENCESLFKPFFQADSSTTRRFGGTGLGLAISGYLASIMGGTISVESIQGKGSEFTLIIPVRKSASGHTLQTGFSASELELLKGKKVLVVDDNSSNCSIIMKILSSWGIITDSAESGSRAIYKLLQAEAAGAAFDSVVIDSDMKQGEMDGIKTAETIKSYITIKDTNIIYMRSKRYTDYVTQEGALEFSSGNISEKISEVILKPVRSRELLCSLVKILSAEERGEN